MRFSMSVVFLVSSVSVALAQPPEAGISQALAESRAARISNLRYELRLAITELTGAPIRGWMTVSLTLRDAAIPLVLDFAPGADHIVGVTANEKPVDYEAVNGHIVIPAASTREGDNQIAIAFRAGDASLNRNKDFLYALFVPARAHLAIPCFDQPDLKARWKLSISIKDHDKQPAHWRVVANGAEVPGDELYFASGDSPDASSNGRVFEFAETEPLPTYLFSFVVGDFKVETATRNGRIFRMFHRETDAAKVARNRDAIFDLHARAIEHMERYTSIPYAFGKFDFVLIPAFQFGGMEHAGKILYNASGLMLDESATQNQLLGRASVIAHETAHMWFGDLVTMRWFNDVWMKEVFANFMAAKIVNPSFPEVNHELRFLLAHYPAAYDVDRTAGANPIRQTLNNLSEAGGLYGAIIYQKAPIVMRHLESLMGEEVFRDGLREYLKAFAFKNATWLDLIAILDTRTPVDLGSWSKVWVEEPGRPAIATELDVEDGRIRSLAFRQRDPSNQARQWPEQLRVVLGHGATMRTITVPMDEERVEVKEAAGLPAPLYVLPNGGGWAYGGFTLDRPTLAYLSASIFEITDPLTRGSAWVTLWDAMLEQEVTAAAIVDLALAALPRETDEQLTSRLLGYTERAWWRFLSPTERMARAHALEATLRKGLIAARTPSLKSAWFNALRDIAIGAETVAWLRRVWAREETLSGLTLAETDYIALAERLAVREVKDWRGVLQAQLGRIENPDRKQRFQFVMPALSADAAERERWFTSLEEVANRRREPWVLDGLSYLHHPLRAQQSAKYVPKSLAMLQEIQRTGDIFFPKRWLDSTLGGHSSPEVASVVQKFLESLPPDYPARLRAITLQSSDELFRAATTSRR
jgi:aminopeptidase N